MKPIPGYPGYFAAVDGTIYSIRHRHGSRAVHPIKPDFTNNGYASVWLHIGGWRCKRKVHRLVLETFVGPRPFGMVACHGPNGRRDNSLANLSWDTQKKNAGPDMVRDGTIRNGELATGAKLNRLQVRIIRRVGHSLSQRELGRVFGVRQSTIGRIQTGERWGWLLNRTGG